MFISSEVSLWLGSANHLQISYTNHRLVTCIQLIGMIKYNRYLLRTHYVYGNNELPRTQSWSCRIRATVPSLRPRAGLQTGSPFTQIVWWWVRFQGRLFAVRFPPGILFQGASALPSPAPHSPQTHFYKSVKTVSGFPGGSVVKNPPSNAGDTGDARDTFDPWVLKIPWRRKWQPTPVLLPGKFRGQRSLVGYSTWGRKEMDMTECTHTHTHTHAHTLGSRTFYFSMYSHMISGHILFTQMNDWQMTRLGNSCYRRNFPFKKIQHAHPHRAAVCQLTHGKWLIRFHKGGLSNTHRMQCPHLNQGFDSATPQTVARQALLSSTLSRSVLKFTSTESVMLSSSSFATPSFCLQSFPGSRSFPMSWLLASSGQSTAACRHNFESTPQVEDGNDVDLCPNSMLNYPGSSPFMNMHTLPKPPHPGLKNSPVLLWGSQSFGKDPWCSL